MHVRDAGNWLFSGRRWRDPSNPADRSALETGYAALTAEFPYFSRCSRERFLSVLGVVCATWETHCLQLARPSSPAREGDVSRRQHRSDSPPADSSGAFLGKTTPAASIQFAASPRVDGVRQKADESSGPYRAALAPARWAADGEGHDGHQAHPAAVTAGTAPAGRAFLPTSAAAAPRSLHSDSAARGSVRPQAAHDPRLRTDGPCGMDGRAGSGSRHGGCGWGPASGQDVGWESDSDESPLSAGLQGPGPGADAHVGAAIHRGPFWAADPASDRSTAAMCLGRAGRAAAAACQPEPAHAPSTRLAASAALGAAGRALGPLCGTTAAASAPLNAGGSVDLALMRLTWDS